jgi:predicted AAA+ superfamily ATPase
LFIAGGKRYGFECKVADSPRVTKSMRIASEDLGLEHLWVVYPGSARYPLDERITVVPAGDISGLARQISG